MVVSYSAVEDILSVVLRYVDKPTAKKIVKDLKQIGGNQSFRDTVDRLERKLNTGP